MKYFILLFFSMTAVAEIPQNVQTEIDLRVKHGINPSIVVGFYENDQSHVYSQGLGLNDPTKKVDENSVYEIGSITKTFTALLLALMVNNDTVKLDDAVQDHWPKPFKLQDSDNQAITFKHLATHTSGLPRMPNNIKLFSDDPYAQYDRSLLIKAVNSTQPRRAGVEYAYSNYAVGLLGETMSVIENQPFNALIEQKIIQPLALSQTYMQLNQVPVDQLVQGYQGKKTAAAWNFKALAAAGSIRSSIKDLLAYGVAHLDSGHQLADAMQLVLSNQFKNDQVTMGLGWHIDNGIYWHNGGTQGFRSIIMIDPKAKRVAAGITNHDKYDVEDIVAHLMDPNRAMKKHDYPVTIANEKLPQFVGQFKHHDTNKVIEITQENNQLIFNTKGQKNQSLQFIGDDTFKFGLMKIKVKFNKNETGEVMSLSLMAWGKPQVYEKTTKNQ